MLSLLSPSQTRLGEDRLGPPLARKAVMSVLWVLEAGVAGAATENERGQRDDRSNQTTHVSLPLVLVPLCRSAGLTGRLRLAPE